MQGTPPRSPSASGPRPGRLRDTSPRGPARALAWFEPYDRGTATRWLRVALLVFATVPLLSARWDHPSALVVAVPLAISLVCATAWVATLRRWVPGPVTWAVTLLASTVLIVVSDLATRDAAATGMVVFLVPAVLAAAQLRRAGAWLVTAAAGAGALVVSWAVLPPATATATWVTVAATLALLTGLLAHTAHRNHDLNAELRHHAAIDSLTGLVTRRVLDGALAAALQGSAAARGNGLLVIDIDHFKRVNDTHGHLAGDEALRHAGAVVSRVAGPTAVVSRLGGDELAVLLPGSSCEQVSALAEAVVDAVRRSPLLLDDVGAVPLTVSVGAAHSPTHATDGRDLYRAADEALYAAKRAGRDRHRTAAARTASGSGPSCAPAQRGQLQAS